MQETKDGKALSLLTQVSGLNRKFYNVLSKKRTCEN